MASLKYLVHLDLLQNELQNVRLQQLSAAPTSPTPVTGQMYYNTGDNKAYVYNGTGWVDVMQQTSTYTLPEATKDVRGGIELFSNTDNAVVPNAVSATAGRTYGLQLNSGGQGVVNVPWVNTTYSIQDGELSANNFTDVLLAKLNAVEASADVTDATNVTAAGALMDSELTDLSGVKGVTISTLQVKPTEGAFANGDKTKLDGIEASADVTDTTNVTAAGALMDSEVTNLAEVKAFASSDYATAAQGTKANTAHGWGNHASAGYSTATGVENSADVTDTANVKTALNASFGGSATIGDGSDTFTIPGNLIVTGDTTTASETVKIVTDNTLQFEGAAGSTASTELNLTTAQLSGSDKTVTLKNETGTIALTSDITGTNSGTNTGDETKSSIEGLGIQTVGAVTSGSWTATDVAVAHGGTGASSASAARTNLGVAYASDAQALAGSVDTVVLTPGNLAARSYRVAIGDASATAYTVNHALGTRDVMVQLYDASTYDTVVAQVVRTDDENVTVTFNSAPSDEDVIVLVNKID